MECYWLFGFANVFNTEDVVDVIFVVETNDNNAHKDIGVHFIKTITTKYTFNDILFLVGLIDC